MWRQINDSRVSLENNRSCELKQQGGDIEGIRVVEEQHLESWDRHNAEVLDEELCKLCDLNQSWHVSSMFLLDFG